MDQMIGKRLDGRYFLEGVIGVGGMANVYKAADLRTEKTVAVKILREEFLQNAELVRRFKNESKAISILDHPNIVKVVDVSVTDKLNYIVMEYIEGITLKEYMNQRGGPLTWKETIHFISQVLDALEHAHGKGVVHRDVKPQNIMLMANGTLKMMDFGIARFSREQSVSVSEKAIGSVHYISPEQASGAETDQTTDIYSVGVMMYEMLSGRLPFESEDAMAVVVKQISDKAPSLHEIAPDVPMALVEIAEHAMAKRPINRYQSASDMLEDLRKFKQDPDIRFQYQYLTEDSPSRYINKVVNKRTTSRAASGRDDSGEKRRTVTQATTRRKMEAVEEKPRKKKRKKRGFPFIPIMLGITLACCVATFYTCTKIFANSSNPLFSERADVDLQNFVGMTRKQVESTDTHDKLNIVFVEEYNTNVPEGQVFGQVPKSGRVVKEGQTVTLKVSLGTLYIPVPNVSYMLQADAQQTLKDAGLTVSVRPTYLSESPVGTVVETDPLADTMVASGTTVTVYVSKEKVDLTRRVPNLEGLTQEDARTALQNNGLVLGVVTEGFSDQPEGVVYAQSIAPDTETRVGTAVDVAVSLGVESAIVAPEEEGLYWNGEAWIVLDPEWNPNGGGNEEE